MTQNDIKLCDTQSAIDALAKELAALEEGDCIALDSEFDRTVTYYPRFALLQLCFRGRVYLADPQQTDLAPVLEALCQTPALCLLFSAVEDLEVLARASEQAFGVRDLPKRLADLQLLSAFTGRGYMRGLAATLESELGVALEKSETRSDWTARPFSAKQIEYAAQDVEYLEALWQKLLSEAYQNDRRVRWFFAAMEELRGEALEVIPPEDAYMGIAGAGMLSHEELLRLQYLCQKRAEYAMEHNEALNRVITGKALCDLAKQTPLTRQGLASCRVNWGAVRQHGDQILEWIRGSMSLPDRELKPPYDAWIASREQRRRAERLKRILAAKAAEQGIAPELLGNRRLVTDFFYCRKLFETPKVEKGWISECLRGIKFDQNGRITKK